MFPRTRESPELLSSALKAKWKSNPNPAADRTVLAMNGAPFGGNFNDEPYRAIRTKQYTYARTPEGPSMFFDNIKDPYQMNNLLGKPEYAQLQNELDSKLNTQLVAINDVFGNRDYYLKKWNYTLDKEKNAIPYWGFDEGGGNLKGTVDKNFQIQSPKPISKQ